MYQLHLILLCVSFCSLFRPTASFCYEQNANTEFTRFGRAIKFCSFRGIKLLSGSRLKTQDCFSCNCTTEKLKCCGFGVNSGLHVVPRHCKMLKDGCTPHYVRRDNENVDCVSGTPIMIDDSAHKKSDHD
ncbi:beta-microseminoprotein [Octopus bimaculoides]|uniref:Beta-microseminoprotein n=1 Tax=Octopus bimaculoides TaxID=37653 RepID=A0A0L8G6P4_OCTBM|nr:beta-microseminoprotein [Octopus bimaculoides]|eukprot:XP_014783575.1 PREDICTED: beta-microseminoprotein-like [Octopus bimaculoides]